MRLFRLVRTVLLVSMIHFLLPATGLTDCTARLTCWDGSQLTCELQGSGRCSAGSDYIYCGNRVYTCPPQVVCTATLRCPDGTDLYCEGTTAGTGNCYEDWCLIVCDGIQYNCPGYEYDDCPGS